METDRGRKRETMTVSLKEALCTEQSKKYKNAVWNKLVKSELIGFVGHTYTGLSSDPRQPQVQDHPPDV